MIASTDQNNNAFEDPNNVAENFDNDFLNDDPRDILLVIDTSSSIYVDDFEVKLDTLLSSSSPAFL